MKRICIIGGGAIGGFIGAKLAAAGNTQVSVLTRGDSLDALRNYGWRLKTGDKLIQAPVYAASDSASDLGPQDLIFIAVKGPVLADVASAIEPLLNENTVIVPMMNGVPWWFCENVEGFPVGSLKSVDPTGAIGRGIAYERVLGAVVHASCFTPEPGLVHNVMGQGLIIGEPRGGTSTRSSEVAVLLAGAGFNVTHSENVRFDIWYKLWGNMTMNPVSALTGATIDRVLDDPLVREYCSACMREASMIGNLIGCTINQTPDDRHLLTAKLGAFKTSMLQDVEAGREIELDAIVTAVHEIGSRLNIPIPNISALLGLARLFGRVKKLYPAE